MSNTASGSVTSQQDVLDAVDPVCDPGQHIVACSRQNQTAVLPVSITPLRLPTG